MINEIDLRFRNQTHILIAEMTGLIPQKFSIEYHRLSAFQFYPPMNREQIRTLACDNVTNESVEKEIFERLYQRLEVMFVVTMNEWNSIVQGTAKRYVSMALHRTMEDLKIKLMETEEFPRWIVQRFLFDTDDREQLILV